MKNVTQMIMLVKEASNLSKDKEIEELLGVRPMGLASLKKENRVGSFLKFLVPYCEKQNISIDDFLKDDLKEVDKSDNDESINIYNKEEEDMAYRDKYETLMEKYIAMMEENSILKEQLLKKAPLSKTKVS
jgi:hypothetical protein